jgi:TM2 domain-containing membrane protein YozV
MYMKNTVKTLSYILGLSMALFSCSVERNSVTRGGESSYGIGSGVAGAHKSSKKMTPVAESDAAGIAEEQHDSKTAVVNETMAVASMKPACETTSPKVNSANTVAPAFAALPKLVKKFSNMNRVNSVNKSMNTPAISTAAKGESKSWYWTIFLCFFFGVLGAHRFYLGYNWQGWVQLFTLGGLGIWWLIDFVRILMRKLEPRCGIYEDI